jgi:hypothetical protein
VFVMKCAFEPNGGFSDENSFFAKRLYDALFFPMEVFSQISLAVPCKYNLRTGTAIPLWKHLLLAGFQVGIHRWKGVYYTTFCTLHN